MSSISIPSTTTNTRESRVLEHGGELRAAGDRKLSGYAALYSVETTIGSLFREKLAPGAFRDALTRKDDVRALFNHDANQVLGRTAAGTLRLTEDARGLRYDIDLPDTQAGRDLWTSVHRGDISQSSFAFSVETEEWPTVRGSELPLRVVRSLRLFDVSPVTYPAYQETTVSARAKQHARQHPVEGDHRAWAATLRARAASVAIGAGHRIEPMPAAFRGHPASAKAWAATVALRRHDAVRLAAAARR